MVNRCQGTGDCGQLRTADNCELRTTRLRAQFGEILDGRGGIRTHGTLLTYTHFPGVRLKPLGHPSQHRFEARSIQKLRLLRTTDCNRGQLRTADNSAPHIIRRDTRRTGRDSNSRYRVHRYAGFRDRCLQPLGHLSCSLASYRAKRPTSTRVSTRYWYSTSTEYELISYTSRCDLSRRITH